MACLEKPEDTPNTPIKFMPNSPRTSIVIVSFNARELVLRCIDSLLLSSAPLAIHISDNGSVDGLLEAIDSRYANRLNIALHPNKKNLGFAAASNIPLPSLNSEYVLFLNPDAIIAPDTIEKMQNFMDKETEVGMAGPLIKNEDGTEQRGCRRREPTPAKAFNTLAPFRRLHSEDINMYDAPLPDNPIEVDSISGAFMFVRKEALDDVGPMDKGYFLHCEDLDWCKRFRDKGWKVMFLPDVTVTHFKGGSSRDRPVRVEWHKHKGMARYYRKFYRDQYPKPLMWLVYTAIWGRFILLAPILTVKRWLK